MSDAPMTNEPLPLCPDDPGVSLTREIAGETPAALLTSILNIEIWRDHGPEETFGPKFQKAIDALMGGAPHRLPREAADDQGGGHAAPAVTSPSATTASSAASS